MEDGGWRMEDGGWRSEDLEGDGAMALIKSFRELDVYRMAVLEAKRIFVLTQSFQRMIQKHESFCSASTIGD